MPPSSAELKEHDLFLDPVFLPCFNTIFYITCFYLLRAVFNVSQPSWTVYLPNPVERWKPLSRQPPAAEHNRARQRNREGSREGRANRRCSLVKSWQERNGLELLERRCCCDDVCTRSLLAQHSHTTHVQALGPPHMWVKFESSIQHTLLQDGSMVTLPPRPSLW